MVTKSLLIQKVERFGKLKTNLLLSFLGTASYSGFKWLMLLILIKVGSTESVGTFSLGASIVAPIFTLFCLNLRTIQVTDVDNDYSLSNYFVMRLLTIGVSAIITLIVAIVGDFDYSTKIILVLFIGVYIVEMLSDITNGYWQKEEKMVYVSLSLILRGAIGFIVFSFIFLVSKSLEISISAYLISLILVCYFYDIRNVKFSGNKLFTKIQKKTIMKFIIVAFPLTIIQTANSFSSNIPNWLIELNIGRDALGIFSAMVNISIIGSMVVNAAGLTLTPRYAQLLKENKIKEYLDYIKRTQIYCFILNLLLILLLYLSGEKLLKILYTSEYTNYIDILILMSIASGISYMSSLLGCGITAAKIFSKQMWINIFICVLIFVMGSILIPMFGLYGACFTLIFSNLIKYFIHLLFINRIISINLINVKRAV
jgi:O-antigen/teichoic acid export membrane protein